LGAAGMVKEGMCMPKRAASVERPDIALTQGGPLPLYRQLYERLRAQMLSGQLEPGARLPSTRALASELGASRNTVALAYELLRLEGYLESRTGDGTRIARLQPQRRTQVSPGANAGDRSTDDAVRPPAALAQRGQMLVDFAESSEFFRERANMDTHVFSVGLPDVAPFPFQTWARLVAKHARHSLQSAALYQNPQGYLPLREAIAGHIGITRGVHCSSEQIVLTAGSQGALDLVARVLLDPGDPAWVEKPGYRGARGALLAAGARLVPVPVDDEGLDVEAGRRLCPDARLAIVTPSHQFPTAVTMSLSRRLVLLRWSREASAWIVEDDYDSEYRYSGRPLEALQGLESGGRVIYIGTFSKVLFPSLRLGYLVVPPELLRAFVAAHSLVDVHLPVLEQMALADFIAVGHFARHLRTMRQMYLERRNALVDALRSELGDLLEVVVPEAGLHLVAWLSDGMSAQAVTRHMAGQGLRFLRISQSSQRRPERDGLLLGFASGSPEELRAGVRVLARALRSP
jgi:GntR family transcriptional regulator / MocR family aminotransferase